MSKDTLGMWMTLVIPTSMPFTQNKFHFTTVMLNYDFFKPAPEGREVDKACRS
jgi:hypothetical protein